MFLCTGMIRILLEYLREHAYEYYVKARVTFFRGSREGEGEEFFLNLIKVISGRGSGTETSNNADDH